MGRTPTLGQYEIEHEIGQGGMGTVYKGRDTKLGRPVAIKILNPEIANNKQAMKRFLGEARTLSQLNHDNIVTIHTLDDEGIQPFMAMEFVEGKVLEECIKAKPMPIGVAVNVFSKILDAIGCAHDKGVVHRDIKPSNVILTKKGSPKVIDFGIALPQKEQLRLTRMQIAIGTPQYMSPEQARCGEIDARSDIYSLGILLFEMLHGHAPFRIDPDEAATQEARVRQEPPKSEVFDESIPVTLQTVIQKSLSTDKMDRFQTTDEFRREIDKCLNAQALGSTSVEAYLAEVTAKTGERLPARVAKETVLERLGGKGSTSRPVPPFSRVRWKLYALLIILLLIAVPAGVWLFSLAKGFRRPVGSPPDVVRPPSAPSTVVPSAPVEPLPPVSPAPVSRTEQNLHVNSLPRSRNATKKTAKPAPDEPPPPVDAISILTGRKQAVKEGAKEKEKQ